MIPTDKLKEILEKAGKATAERWDLTSDGYNIITSSVWVAWTANNKRTRTPVAAKNAAHIASCDPTTISSIIRELLAWREIGKTALCEIAEWGCDLAPGANAKKSGCNFSQMNMAREALRKVEEAGEGDVCR